MISLSGYKVLSQIYSGKSTSVYRGILLEKNLPVILKILNAEYPLQEDISRLKHEYNLIKDLNLPGVVHAYQLEKIEHRYVLVLEDVPDSMTLADFIANHDINLDLFLPFALQISRILQEMHTAHVIHKDLNPSNIIITENDHQVKLIDFSIATQLSQEKQEITSPEGLEGTLPYMSPEQTARMNRVIDRRTDLYSLGIIFYLMLTGCLPFEAQDPLEWVYCHIAKRPKPPRELNAQIPETISNIVMKLLAKAPEDRYSTAYGLAADLEHFIAPWQRKQEAISFPLGEKDRTSLFQIPQKLYGREIEIEQLMRTFSRISQGARELLLVHGYAGIGKTSLINEIHKPIVRQHGYFISGKFDQFQQNIPYYGLIQAFRQLIKQLLAENQKRVTFWREQLLNVLSPNGQVIIEVIPEVEWLIGKQSPVPKLPASEAQNRFELVFFDFVQTFCQEDHPVVIFLDDLQWADLASFDLITKLMKDDELKYLLMIGAYRDNDVNVGHPLLDMIEDLTKANVPIDKLQLKPLSPASVKQLVADTLNTSLDIEPLAELVYEKTGGNPFFCNTFLTMLHEERYLTFDSQRAEWKWDMYALRTLTVADNVVDLLISKMGRLPRETQEVLKVAACIGNQFDLKTLATVAETSLPTAAKALWPLLKENLVIPLSEGYKLILADPDYALRKQSILYKFSHDRIQQAAYALLTLEQHKVTHIKLARLLLANFSDAELDERLFEVVNHFNLSLDLIKNTDEKFEIAKLNIQAGNKAKLSIAYQSAADYFEFAIKLLGENAWQTHYAEAIEANLAYAELTHLLGKFVAADTQFAELIEKASNPLDKARIYMFQTLSYAIQAKWEESIDAGLKGLEILGMKIKKHPSIFHIFAELIKTKWAMSRVNLNNLLKQLSILSTPEKMLILDFLERVIASAYNVDFNLVATLSLQSTRYSLKNGYNASAAVSFTTYAIMLITGFHDYNAAVAIGNLSVQMVEKFADMRAKTRVYVAVSLLIFPWKLPYRECFPKAVKAYALGRQSGELLWAGYAASVILLMMIDQGDELDDIATKLKSVSVVPEFTGFMDVLITTRLLERTIPVLKGDKPPEYLNELLQSFFNTKLASATYSGAGLLYLMTLYVLEDWDAALRITAVLKPYIKAPEITAVFTRPNYYFFASLVMVSVYEKAGFIQKNRYRREIRSHLRKMKKWAETCPANYAAKYQLMLGGWLQITGKSKQVVTALDRAISLAREYHLTHIEAIANEFAGRLHKSAGLLKYAKLFMQEAALLYQRWGAKAKVQLLQKEYPEFFVPSLPQSGTITAARTRSISMSTSTSISTTHTQVGLDLTSIMKAVQTISSNVVLDDLLRSFIQIVMENAGASRCLLLLEHDNQLVLAAKSKSADADIQLSKNQPIDPNEDLCLPLVQYVQHTQESVVLTNATRDGPYTEDIYVLKHKPLSILCLPIIHKAHMLGVLYLENNLAAGVFTHDHLDVLRLLAGQAAISLQNSQLFLASDRFVPHEFLDILGKHSIVDIQIGDYVQKEMTIRVCDIRGFTTLSEQLTPAENFQLMNEYLSYMEPVITEQGGFIDKFIGDAIMALFPGDADKAVSAGVGLQQALEKFNQTLRERKVNPLRVGIGMNSGKLILGTLGGKSQNGNIRHQ